MTGGTGFFGRHLVRRLAAQGQQVRVLSRTPGRVALPGAVEWAQGDLFDPLALARALQGVDSVVHAAAVLGATAGADFLRVNAEGTACLARAARAASVLRFVHVSSGGVYGDGSSDVAHRETDPPAPGNAYERSKLAAEGAVTEALAGSKVRWTLLRPQGLYAADRPATVAQFREIARRRVWLHGPARVLVHPTHVDDLVSAVELVLRHEGLHGEVINIGGERALDYSELVAMIAARMGRRPLQARAPRWAAAGASAAARALGRAGMADRLSRRWINRAVSIDKARALLGFVPVALAQGLDRTAAELRAQPR